MPSPAGRTPADTSFWSLYGPRDTFDPARSHVIPALIRKMVDARRTGAAAVEVWGTGRASREFLYVEDCARAIALAAERYDAREPVNVGAGSEIRIAELAQLIASLCGFGGRLTFNPSLPDGQPRRSLDVSRAEQAFGFHATTPLEHGLRRTIAWYERQPDSGPSTHGAWRREPPAPERPRSSSPPSSTSCRKR